MSLIILSALGTGNYRETKYQTEHHPELVTTGLFAIALHQWYPEAQVKLLATQGARESLNGDYVRKNYSEFELIDIPDSSTEEEAWKLFQTIADHIPQGSRVIFDITHGFRSLPMLGFLALSYLRVVKQITIERVFYGALGMEIKNEEGLTPVIDLTPFVALLDWAQAAERFADTGDTRKFSKLLTQKVVLGTQQKKGKRKGSYMPEEDERLSRIVGKDLLLLSENLFANRGQDIGPQATKVIQSLENLEQLTLSGKHRPLAIVLEQIKESVSPLKHSPLPELSASEETRLILQAEYAQICWFTERQHYVQALALATEWCINVRSWHDKGYIETDYKLRVPMNADLHDAIEEEGKRRAELKKNKENYDADSRKLNDIPEELWELAWVSWDINLARNDLMHFGFRKQPSQADKVVKKARQIIALLPSAVRPLGLELENVSSNSNLTEKKP